MLGVEAHEQVVWGLGVAPALVAILSAAALILMTFVLGIPVPVWEVWLLP